MSSSLLTMQRPAVSGCPGRLDGLTILRFAHAYETGGGVELHLRDLNQGLSRRNALKTIQVHLAAGNEETDERSQSIGKSKLIKVPLRAACGSCGTAGLREEDEPGILRGCLGWAMNLILFSFGLNRFAMRFFVWWRRVPKRPLEAINAGAVTAELLERHAVDLVVLHSNGGADASEVIAAAGRARVAVAMIHHFSNDRLGNVSVRQQAAEVETIAGASEVGLPFYVRRRFTNLSDAVDLDFFRVENASPVPVRFDAPVIFAPGRITPDKGQMDALKVAVELHRRGLRNTLVFAGRVDDAAFENALREEAAAARISDFVHFAGELTLQQYRDWFNASCLMLMPTHHHEGMPRTLIDSQAMRVPPIVYDIGGTSDGVRHGKTGFLVQLGDIPAMAQHAISLLKSRELRERMAANGRAFVEAEFSMDAFLARHESFYLDALSRFSKRAGRGRGMRKERIERASA